MSFQEPDIRGSLAVYYHGIDSDEKREEAIKECMALIRCSGSIKSCVFRLLRAGVKFDAYGMDMDSAKASVEEVFGAEFADEKNFWTEKWIPDGMILIALPQIYFVDRNADPDHAREYKIHIPGSVMKKCTEGFCRYNRWIVWAAKDYYYLQGDLHRSEDGFRRENSIEVY